MLNIDEHDRAVLATAAGEWPWPRGPCPHDAAVQPFLSGGISKTVNLPKTATVEDVSAVYKLAWEQASSASPSIATDASAASRSTAACR